MNTLQNKNGIVRYALTEFAIKQKLSLDEIKLYLKRKYRIIVSNDVLERRLRKYMSSKRKKSLQ